MAFKINISDKTGKTYKVELETENLVGKSLHDKISGKDILPDLNGYELEITGASDNSGFPAMKNVSGIGLKRELLTYGTGMKKRPRKEGKKKRSTPKPKGLRLRKTVRGEVISPAITQINMKVLKEGGKKLSEIFESKKESEGEKSDKEKSPEKSDSTKPEEKEKKKEVEKEPQEKEESKENEKKNKEKGVTKEDSEKEAEKGDENK